MYTESDDSEQAWETARIAAGRPRSSALWESIAGQLMRDIERYLEFVAIADQEE